MAGRACCQHLCWLASAEMAANARSLCGCLRTGLCVRVGAAPLTLRAQPRVGARTAWLRAGALWRKVQQGPGCRAAQAAAVAHEAKPDLFKLADALARAAVQGEAVRFHDALGPPGVGSLVAEHAASKLVRAQCRAASCMGRLAPVVHGLQLQRAQRLVPTVRGCAHTELGSPAAFVTIVPPRACLRVVAERTWPALRAGCPCGCRWRASSRASSRRAACRSPAPWPRASSTTSGPTDSRVRSARTGCTTSRTTRSCCSCRTSAGAAPAAAF